jgi:hypothetical protein
MPCLYIVSMEPVRLKNMVLCLPICQYTPKMDIRIAISCCRYMKHLQAACLQQIPVPLAFGDAINWSLRYRLETCDNGLLQYYI